MKNYFRKFFNPYYMGGGIRKFYDAAPAGGGGGAKTEKEQLLESITNQVEAVLTKRGLKPDSDIGKVVTEAMNTTLKDIKLDALRNFDGTALAESVNKLSTQFEKFKQNSQLGATRNNKLDAIREVLRSEAFNKEIDSVFASEPESKKFLTINAKRAAVVMNTTNVMVSEDIPEDILHSFEVEAFVRKRRPKEYIFNIASRRTVGEIVKYKTWLEEGTEDGAFAIVAEGALKPLMSKKLIRNTSEAQKVAGKRVYTEEVAKFKKEVYGIIEDLFNDQIMRNYAAILTTNLIAASAAYVGTSLDGLYTKPTDFHAIGAVSAQIESLDFEPDLLIINPQDKWRIGLQQGEDGHFFINIPMLSPSGQVTMMGFRVLTTNRIDVGEFILGESGLYKIEDEPIQIRMGYGITVTKDGGGNVTEVEDDFDHNRFRIIAETWFHDYIASAHIGSFVKANFADVKEALTAVEV